MCKNYAEYDAIDEYKNGILYDRGNRLDLKEYFKGNIVTMKEENENTDFFDLIAFDQL